MTEQELREKLIDEAGSNLSYYCLSDSRLGCLIDLLLPVFQNWLKQANYVQLADDQSLPENKQPAKYWVTHPHFETAHDAVSEAQQDMLDKGFRNVES